MTDRETLQELVDRQAIAELLHDYCTFLDTNQPERVSALFVEDCVADYGPSFGGPIQGRERIERGCARTLAMWAATSHHLSNIRIAFPARDRAEASSYLYAWHKPLDGGPDFQLWARYYDRLVRTPEGWRLAERRLRAAGQSGREFDFEPIERAPS